MAITREVHPVNMVAHLWAHATQKRARNSQRNFYFEGDTIYSYGAHFPIARRVTRNGETAVLFTTQGYSSTTAKHKCIVSRACGHLPRFDVPRVHSDDGREHFAAYQKQYQDLVKSYGKARQRKPEILRQMRVLVSEANALAKFYGLRSRMQMPADEAAMQAEAAAITKKQAAAERAAERKRQQEIAKQKAGLLEKLEQWATNNGPLPYGADRYSQHARLRIVGDEIETSYGASVPLEHALRAFRILAEIRARGETYQRSEHAIHVGHFTISAMDADGIVTAGCHTIEWAEIERVAALAGETVTN